MHTIIKKELKKVKVADLSNFKNNVYHIKKYESIKMIEGKYYIIKIKESFFNNINNNVITTNWNNGSIPDCNYYEIDINKILNRMININGVGYDIVSNITNNKIWHGWIPIDQIEVIKQL